MMSINELVKLFQEAEQTPEYQLERVIVDITEDICEVMEAKGVSRADLARQLGKSRAWVTKVLRGDQNMTLRTIVEIFWSLGYKVDFNTKLAWTDSTGWKQVEPAYSSESVVRVYPSRPLDDDPSAYKEESVEENAGVTNVRVVAA